MKKIRFKNIFRFAAALVISASLFADSPGDFEKGKVIDKVVCQSDKEQSYALYLPGAYSKEKKWPILFAFDPAARATLPLELFKEAAEKYHYIIVCSNNARNGPWELIIKAINAVWQDTGKRFSIDTDRIYTTGFSGGARAAAAFPHIVGKSISGIIACGAGLPSQIKAEQVKPAYYYGIVGLEDFNYKEFVRLGKELAQAGVHHIIDVIDGPHKWAPKDVCTRAVDWMEIAAVKRGIKEKDNNLIDTVYRNVLDRGLRLEEAGKAYYAVSFYKFAIALFAGLKDTTAIENKKNQLEASEEFRAFSREEKLRNEKEKAYISRFAYVFSLVRNVEPGKMKLKKVLKDLQLSFLLKEASRKDDFYNRAMARRLLLELRIKGNEEGAKYLKKGNLKRAVIFLETAARADSTDPLAFYNLACCCSLKNDKKEALKNLKRFVELALKQGYKNFSYIDTDEHLDSIRKEREFQEILRFIKQKK